MVIRTDLYHLHGPCIIQVNVLKNKHWTVWLCLMVNVLKPTCILVLTNRDRFGLRVQGTLFFFFRMDYTTAASFQFDVVDKNWTFINTHFYVGQSLKQMRAIPFELLSLCKSVCNSYENNIEYLIIWCFQIITSMECVFSIFSSLWAWVNKIELLFSGHVCCLVFCLY